jgi:hypothetical protein
MVGTYGHEAEHRDMSEHLYGLNRKGHVATGQEGLLATAYSCRSQVKRLDGVGLRHPAQALLRAIPAARRIDPAELPRAAWGGATASTKRRNQE